MNKRQDRTFDAIFTGPAPANIRWGDVASLLKGIGAEQRAVGGSRSWFRLRGMAAVLHRPHPGSQLTRPGVRSVREFLEGAGFGPENRPDREEPTGMLEYKGYTGDVELDVDAGIMHGRVLGIRAVVTFESDTIAGIKREFEASVDSYLEMCRADGEEPEKSFSGRFNRLSAHLPLNILELPTASGVSRCRPWASPGGEGSCAEVGSARS